MTRIEIRIALVAAILMLPISAPAQTDLIKLERDGRKALTSGPFSVTSKAITPPSGDKHDYMSQAPYFWPDPNRPNGWPYIRRDGERNPEIEKITDHRVMDQMGVALPTTRRVATANFVATYTTRSP